MLNKPFAESCEQNKTPIIKVLEQWFTLPDATVFEIGSGTGQHACYFSEKLGHLHWQPSERQENIAAVQAWTTEALGKNGRVKNILPVCELDVSQQHWPDIQVEYIFSANTVHIMSWPEVEDMFTGIRRILKPAGIFCLYGPFNYQGSYTSPSNADFDQWLKTRDPKSGIRDVEALCNLGHRSAPHKPLKLIEDHEMPQNNRILVFQSPSSS